MAQGGMRDAQSILDQMISFCGKTITQENVLDVYGLVSRDRIVRLGQNIFEGNFEEILRSLILLLLKEWIFTGPY